ncbi:Filament-forming protein, partial [Tieghemiomyces parasiticus]
MNGVEVAASPANLPSLADLLGSAGPRVSDLEGQPRSLINTLTHALPSVTSYLALIPDGDATDPETTGLPSVAALHVTLEGALHDAQALDRTLREFLAAVDAHYRERTEAWQAREQSLVNELESTKAAHRLDTLTHEQVVHTLEVRVADAQQALAASQARTTTLEANLTAAQERSHRDQAAVAEHEAKGDELRDRIRTLEQRLEHAETEQRRHLELLDRRVREAEETESRCHEIEAQFTEARNALARGETETQEARAAEATAKLHVTSLEQELTIVRKQNDWLNGELTAKADLFAKYRTEKSEQLAEAQASADRHAAEASGAQATATHLQKKLAEQTERLDEALERARAYRLRLVEQEEDFRAEMGGQTKLAALWEKAADEAKTRVGELDAYVVTLQTELATQREKAADQAAAAQSERETLRAQLASTEADLERARVELRNMNALLVTEARGGAGAAGAPHLILSPAAALASKAQRSGQSFTEIYTDYLATQDRLAEEQRETQRLRECLDHIVKDIESRAPVLNEQRREYDRVCQQAERLADQAAAAETAKETAETQLTEVRSQMEAIRNENGLLTQQVHDLGRQVQTLLREVDEEQHGAVVRNDDGVLVSAARTDTDHVISEQLTTFRDIQELQGQNQRLLRVTRELAARMEREETAAAQRLTEHESQVMRDAEQLILDLREELRLAQTKAQSYRHERDMFQRMLQRDRPSQPGTAPGTPTPRPGHPAGGSPPLDALSAVSVVDDSPGPYVPTRDASGFALALAPNAAATSGPDYASLLRELQTNFDSYRAESGVDLRRVQDQLETAQREAAESRLAHARAQAQVDFLNERYQALVTGGEAQTRDLQTLRERFASAQESLAHAERTNQRAATDLVAAHERLEAAQQEASTLRAENQLFKGVEARLLRENEALSRERSRLNDLLVGLQRVANERDRVEADTIRRHNHRIEEFERTATALRAQLAEAHETARAITFRKEAEAQRYQGRLDQLAADHAAAREQLVAAQTAAEHLRARNDEIAERLRTVEQSASKAAAENAHQAISGPATGLQAPTETASTLQRELLDARQQIARLEDRVAQYRAISAANEEALAQLTATYDAFRASRDEEAETQREAISELRSSVEDKEARLADAVRELGEAQTEVESLRADRGRAEASLRAQAEDQQRRADQLAEWLEQAKTDLRQQTQRTTEAQANYAREVTLHADALRALEELKTQTNETAAERQALRTQAETAQASLQAAETAWTGQRRILEKTAADLTRRLDDLEQQNTLLHAHLETVNAQTLRLQQADAAATDTETSTVAGDASPPSVPRDLETLHAKSVEELREVIRYMRRDRDILQCQHELGLQEAKRLKQQLEHRTRALEEARALLTEERQREQEALLSASQHTELLAKIEELNILRESNTTLRAEAGVQRARADRAEDTATGLRSELEPLHEQVATLTAELEVKERELAAQADDARHWKERAAQILQKYDRIDPVEHQQLQAAVTEARDALAAAESARDFAEAALAEERSRAEQDRAQRQAGEAGAAEQAAEALAAARVELESVTAERNLWMGRSERLKGQFNNKLKDLNLKHAQAIAAKDTALAELRARVAELDQRQSSPEEGQEGASTSAAEHDHQSSADAAAWEAERSSLQQTIEQLEARVHALSEASYDTPTTGTTGDANAIPQLQQELEEARAQVSQLTAEKTQVSVQLEATSREVTQHEQSLDQARHRVAELEMAVASANATAAQLAAATTSGQAVDNAGASISTATDTDDEVVQWRTKYEAAQTELGGLRSEVQRLTDELRVAQTKVAELEARLAATPTPASTDETRHRELVEQAETLRKEVVAAQQRGDEAVRQLEAAKAEAAVAGGANTPTVGDKTEADVAAAVQKREAELREEFRRETAENEMRVKAKLTMFN